MNVREIIRDLEAVYLHTVIDYDFVVFERIGRAVLWVFQATVMPQRVAWHIPVFVVGGTEYLAHWSAER